MGYKKFKIKNFTLFSDFIEGFCWRIEATIKDNGTFNSKGKITIVDKKEQSKYLKKYNQSHKDELKEKKKKYYCNHREEILKHCKKYSKNRKEKIKIRKEKYYREHKDFLIKKSNEWRINNRGKYNATSRKSQNKRKRDLDSIELNEWFEGCEGHHINKEFILYIPKEMHRSIAHNVFTGKNMEKINDLAIKYVYGI